MGLLCMLSGGCLSFSRKPVVRASAIEPLREDEFDRFAGQIAGRITQSLDSRDYQTPVTIKVPDVAGGVERSTVAADLDPNHLLVGPGLALPSLCSAWG